MIRPESDSAGAVDRLLRCEVFAVAGVSSNERKYGTKVFRDLRRAGRRVYGLNPRLAQLDGETVYPDVASLPETPEALVLVVPPAIGLAIVEQAARRGAQRVWMQPGADSPELIERCQALGLEAVYGQCVMIELAARRG
ncbi:MAG: CoA-binding protein [Candidatus Sumerlaeota bacterium]|nr:CoA-binding protein [Candidatus Sumerlaeota bacterium]